MVVDRFASEKRVTVKEKKYHSLIGSWQMNGEKVLLVKPQTYMNRSGEAIRTLFRYFPVALQDLVVIHDDLDLPLGRIRMRPRGRAGGHQGVLSILEALEGEDFFRVRLGIGRPPAGVDPSDFVLDPFPLKETDLVDEAVSKAADALESLLQEGSHRAMERFNRAN
jgi:PTH1 family peptidyl-tRNA hydrolase